MSRAVQLLAYLGLLTALLILLHQYVLYGVLFEVDDLHHETFAIAFLFFSLGVFLGNSEKAGKP